MSVLFLALTLTMSLFALAIVARPLILARNRNDQGFAQLPLLIIVVVVLLAIGLYAIIGRPEAVFAAASNASDKTRPTRMAASASGKKVASIASLLSGLEERLQREPDDAGGWLLLAKSYQSLNRIAEARDAYAKAQALGELDATLETSLAGEPQTASAVTEIRGRVSIAATIGGSLDEDATVYVLAKATNGSPMPLAVLRKTAADLPFEFTLTDELSMVRGSGISSVDKVVVSAKISTSGDALQTDPGYEVHSQPIATANSPFLELEINPAVTTEGQ